MDLSEIAWVCVTTRTTGGNAKREGASWNVAFRIREPYAERRHFGFPKLGLFGRPE